MVFLLKNFHEIGRCHQDIRQESIVNEHNFLISLYGAVLHYLCFL